jgi:hypothetical protein
MGQEQRPQLEALEAIFHIEQCFVQWDADLRDAELSEILAALQPKIDKLVEELGITIVLPTENAHALDQAYRQILFGPYRISHYWVYIDPVRVSEGTSSKMEYELHFVDTRALSNSPR